MLTEVKKEKAVFYTSRYQLIVILMLFSAVISLYLNPAIAQSLRSVHQSKLIENDAKIDKIIAQMTLEEKVAMLHGKNMFTSAGVERLGIADMIYTDGPFGIREEMEPH